MLIILSFILLFILFFLFKKHIGSATLATIAGITIHKAFHSEVIHFLSPLTPNIPSKITDIIFFILLVLFFPILIYLRSRRNKLFGIFRIIEALLFSFLLTSLCAWCIPHFIAIDPFGKSILNFINSHQNVILASGVVIAYFDILLFRNN